MVGTLSRFHLLRPRRKQVVLMDHNEAAQSVRGLDQAEILEIIDHHRLADIQTKSPIYFRNEIVGSTTTIVATMYQEKGLMPTEKMAGLMAAAILSDTVMFKSPTCTQRDIDVANRMARIARISLDGAGPLHLLRHQRRRTSPPRRCSRPTSRSSTSPATIWASARSPAWTPPGCWSARMSSWRS